MVLSLITPVGSDFIKDWPAQNEINMELIDAYAGPCLPTQPLTAYTPQFLGATTNPTLGTAGFIHGYYYRIFDQIYTWGELRFGSAAINAGSGNWSITLPFPADPLTPSDTNPGRAPTLGSGLLIDDSTPANTQTTTIQLVAASEMRFLLRNASGAASPIVGSAGPITWAVQDGMLWYARYKRAP